MKKLTGSVILLITTIIWGLAFTAQSAAADSIPPFTFNTARCLLAALSLLIFLGVQSGAERLWKKERKKQPVRELLIGGLICGVMLFFGMNFQQAGISAYPPEAASTGRAGFITATYVIMIPIIQRISGKKIGLAAAGSVVCCVIGMYLLCMSGGFEGIYLGDLLVFGCAVAYTIYILAVDRYSHLDGIVLSIMQFIVCGVISAVCMLIFEKPELSALSEAWLPVLYAGVLSSGIGYTLQIFGQKRTSPALASIIMSMESVFAALFGWMILGEMLSVREMIGCALVFVSVIAAQIPDMMAGRRKDEV